MANKITFNGTDYDSPDDMPADVRAAYERALAMLQKQNSGGLIKPGVNIKVSTKLRLVHDGRVYNSLDEMPPDVRAKFEKGMQQIDKDHDGIPDFLEGKEAPTAESDFAPRGDSSLAGSTPIVPLTRTASAIQSEGPNRTILLVAGVIIALLICVVVGLVIYISYH